MANGKLIDADSIANTMQVGDALLEGSMTLYQIWKQEDRYQDAKIDKIATEQRADIRFDERQKKTWAREDEIRNETRNYNQAVKYNDALAEEQIKSYTSTLKPVEEQIKNGNFDVALDLLNTHKQTLNSMPDKIVSQTQRDNKGNPLEVNNVLKSILGFQIDALNTQIDSGLLSQGVELDKENMNRIAWSQLGKTPAWKNNDINSLVKLSNEIFNNKQQEFSNIAGVSKQNAEQFNKELSKQLSQYISVLQSTDDPNEPGWQPDKTIFNPNQVKDIQTSLRFFEAGDVKTGRAIINETIKPTRRGSTALFSSSDFFNQKGNLNVSNYKTFMESNWTAESFSEGGTNKNLASSLIDATLGIAPLENIQENVPVQVATPTPYGSEQLNIQPKKIANVEDYKASKVGSYFIAHALKSAKTNFKDDFNFKFKPLENDLDALKANVDNIHPITKEGIKRLPRVNEGDFSIKEVTNKGLSNVALNLYNTEMGLIELITNEKAGFKHMLEKYALRMDEDFVDDRMTKKFFTKEGLYGMDKTGQLRIDDAIKHFTTPDMREQIISQMEIHLDEIDYAKDKKSKDLIRTNTAVAEYNRFEQTLMLIKKIEDIFINDKYLKRFRSSLFSGETTSSTTNILEGLDGILKTNSTPAESTNVKMQINNDWNQYLNSEMNK